MKDRLLLDIWDDNEELLSSISSEPAEVINSVSIHIRCDWGRPFDGCVGGVVSGRTLHDMRSKGGEARNLRICQILPEVSIIDPGLLSNGFPQPDGSIHHATFVYISDSLPNSFDMGLDTYTDGIGASERVAVVVPHHIDLLLSKYPHDFGANPLLHRDCELAKRALHLWNQIQTNLSFKNCDKVEPES